MRKIPKIPLRMAVIIMLMSFCSSAIAEGGCPQGQYPQNTPQARICVPIPGASSGGGSSYSEPVQYYETRWGAIALENGDTVHHASTEDYIYGSATGHKYKWRAKRASLAQCKQHNGVDCKVFFEFHDSCASLVTSSDRLFVNTGWNSEASIKSTMADCEKQMGSATTCKVQKTFCSLAERVG